MDFSSNRQRERLSSSYGFNFFILSDSSSDEDSLRLRNFEFIYQDIAPKIKGMSNEEIVKLGESVWKNEFIVEASKPGSLILKKKEGLCPVCLTNFQTGDVIRNLKCGHGFHKDCIDGWLKIKAVCPLDRLKL